MDTDTRPGLAGLIGQLEALSVRGTLALSVFLGAIVVWFDVLTGPEISFSIFYVAPVAVAAGRLGRVAGIATAIVAAGAWVAADIINNDDHSQSLIPFWNGFVRLGFFTIIAVMTVLVRDLVRELEDEARLDSLTGLLNRRGFSERATLELAHARRGRYPLTIAYLDVDGFKQVNDVSGHAAGDSVLVKVAETASSSLREVDAVGRLGGDEFAFVLPETSADGARVVAERLHGRLTAESDPRIGFSIGVVTFTTPPADLDTALGAADALMYRVKSEGVGGVRYETA